MLVTHKPPAASASRCGVSIGLPKQPNCPKPVSSNTMNNTFGEPFGARFGAGHAGLDSSAVRPITPGKRLPGSYSTIGIPHLLHVVLHARPGGVQRRSR